MIAAAPVFSGTRTGFEKPAPVSAQQQMSFAPGQIIRVDPFNKGHSVVLNLDDRQTTSLNYFPGIREVTALTFNIQGIDVA
jgi:hypothetical protein